LIFLTSNLGSQEMTKLMSGGLGYTGGPHEEDAALDQKIYRTALDAAQRKSSPEFMNRIDKVIVFRTLKREHLEKILDIELEHVQQRIMSSAVTRQFVFSCTPSARDFLLQEGTDSRFGARHLKRLIERHVVFPLTNLLATEQLELGDLVTIDYDPETSKLTFVKENQGALVLPYENAFTIGLYQGTAPAVLERNAKIGGFSRWYPASGAKSFLPEDKNLYTVKAHNVTISSHANVSFAPLTYCNAPNSTVPPGSLNSKAK
jgi:hypothetical protein